MANNAALARKNLYLPNNAIDTALDYHSRLSPLTNFGTDPSPTHKSPTNKSQNMNPFLSHHCPSAPQNNNHSSQNPSPASSGDYDSKRDSHRSFSVVTIHTSTNSRDEQFEGEAPLVLGMVSKANNHTNCFGAFGVFAGGKDGSDVSQDQSVWGLSPCPTHPSNEPNLMNVIGGSYQRSSTQTSVDESGYSPYRFLNFEQERQPLPLSQIHDHPPENTNVLPIYHSENDSQQEHYYNYGINLDEISMFSVRTIPSQHLSDSTQSTSGSISSGHCFNIYQDNNHFQSNEAGNNISYGCQPNSQTRGNIDYNVDHYNSVEPAIYSNQNAGRANGVSGTHTSLHRHNSQTTHTATNEHPLPYNSSRVSQSQLIYNSNNISNTNPESGQTSSNHDPQALQYYLQQYPPQQQEAIIQFIKLGLISPPTPQQHGFRPQIAMGQECEELQQSSVWNNISAGVSGCGGSEISSIIDDVSTLSSMLDGRWGGSIISNQHLDPKDHSGQGYVQSSWNHHLPMNNSITAPQSVTAPNTPDPTPIQDLTFDFFRRSSPLLPASKTDSNHDNNMEFYSQPLYNYHQSNQTKLEAPPLQPKMYPFSQTVDISQNAIAHGTSEVNIYPSPINKQIRLEDPNNPRYQCHSDTFLSFPSDSNDLDCPLQDLNHSADPTSVTTAQVPKSNEILHFTFSDPHRSGSNNNSGANNHIHNSRQPFRTNNNSPRGQAIIYHSNNSSPVNLQE